MSRWDKTCYSFKEVRRMINEDVETAKHCMQIMSELESCCDEMTPDSETEWEFYDSFRDLKSEIHEEIELMDEDDYESCEYAVNNFLREFYDLCDSAKVWCG